MQDLISKKLIALVVCCLSILLLWGLKAVEASVAVATIKLLGITYLGVQGTLDLLKLLLKR